MNKRAIAPTLIFIAAMAFLVWFIASGAAMPGSQ
ncbi:YoaK family small membrane protein [Erwinia sp. SLM-02]|nr:YoaK family small membrane protein [uncultured Erwinia sp.]